MLTVRTARVDELESVTEFYARMIDEMRGTAFDVLWRHNEHPTPAFIGASVKAGEAYVGVLDENDPDASVAVGSAHIAAALIMNTLYDDGYEQVTWQVEAAPDEVAVLHVVGTLPAFHGRGFARQMVAGALEAARAQGKRAVRLDTFVDNVRGRNLYESCGFTLVGELPDFYEHLNSVAAVLYEFVL